MVFPIKPKKQGKNFNTSAVMAKVYGYHLDHLTDANYAQGLHDQQHLLLFRLAHAINQEQELAVPMVMAYNIMGWGDAIHLHCNSPIY